MFNTTFKTRSRQNKPQRSINLLVLSRTIIPLRARDETSFRALSIPRNECQQKATEDERNVLNRNPPWCRDHRSLCRLSNSRASPKTAHIHDTSKPRRSEKNYAEKYADRPKQTSERTRARCVIASKSLFQNANASEPLQNQARKQREVAKQGIEERKKLGGIASGNGNNRPFAELLVSSTISVRTVGRVKGRTKRRQRRVAARATPRFIAEELAVAASV